MRRVVVTGLGVVCPLGRGSDFVFNRLINGESGIRAISRLDTTDMPSKIAGEIPFGTNAGEFDPETTLSAKERRRSDDFITYGIAAVDDALNDAGWHPETTEDQERTGVLMGSGIGGLNTIYNNSLLLKEQGARRVSPFLVPSIIINMLSGTVSIRHHLKGPNHAVVTACASGSHAIGDASRLIMFGDADVMVAGGAENPITSLGMSGFCQARALSTGYNDTPEKASRPFDVDHDGFIMAEGAGAVVLEEYEHAKKRGAHIYAELCGYGLTGDAHHMTAPDPNGEGASRAVLNALKNASLSSDDIDYVNAHGTSTCAGDAAELTAMRRVFNDTKNVAISSTKSMTGHLLGAAGAVEAVFTVKTLEKGILPPTINLQNPIEEATGFNLVPQTAQKKKVDIAVSNSFGFGGTNASLIFKKI